MGSRSQVVIAVKAGPLLDSITANPGPILVHADTVEKDEEGTLWEFDSIKWYEGSDPDIDDFLDRLEEYDEDFLVVVSNEDYPSSEGGYQGGWDDNPWNVCKVVRATVKWDSTADSRTPPPRCARVRVASNGSVEAIHASQPEWDAKKERWFCLFKNEGTICGEAYYDYELSTWTWTR